MKYFTGALPDSEFGCFYMILAYKNHFKTEKHGTESV